MSSFSNAYELFKDGIVNASHKVAEIPKRTWRGRETVTKSERFDAFAVYTGKIGFFSRGFTWCSVGGFAINAAINLDKTEGTGGALQKIAFEGAGFAFLIIATMGIGAYAFWRYFEALFRLNVNPEHRPFSRFLNGYLIPFCSGSAYTLFAVTNIKALQFGHSDYDPDDETDEDKTTKNWANIIASNIAGKLFFTFVAIVVVCVGITWIIQLIKRDFKKTLDFEKIQMDKKRLKDDAGALDVIIYFAAIVGVTGRALLFILLGTLFARIAWDPNVTLGGFGEALDQLLAWKSFGRICLGILGFMLIIFGCFSVLLSRYKKFLFYRPSLNHCANPSAYTDPESVTISVQGE